MARADYTNLVTDRLVDFFAELESSNPLTKKQFHQIQKKYSKSDGSFWSKTELWAIYQQLAGTNGLSQIRADIQQHLQMKPTRTISGVAPVTVLTKPFPCPGKCIFCPNDVRMPKSYLSDEPGAQRAEKNYFDPYLQTYNRIEALHQMGHSIEKIELIILGGTWSYYPEPYQIWFIKECFRAMNEFGVHDDQQVVRERYRAAEKALAAQSIAGRSDNPRVNQDRFGDQQLIAGRNRDTQAAYNQTVAQLYNQPERLVGLDQYQAATWVELAQEQLRNETAVSRNVGLVIETRPDNISPAEVIKIRRLGCTKTQIGIQSLQDEVLTKNHRGHDVAATRKAIGLLRQAGFKIHAHWMPNLYGSSPAADKQDYQLLFSDPDFKPDELKIYPCSLIESAELVEYYRKGLWQPYTEEELLDVLSYCFLETPGYCRLTRVIRDIPSPDIMVGNKKTNFRQLVENWLAKHKHTIREIRAREIRGRAHLTDQASTSALQYTTSVSEEYFLQVTVPDSEQQERLLAFLRLSLPKSDQEPLVSELNQAAMIREVHVYGQATALGQRQQDRAQHVGYGKQLIQLASELASQAGFKRLAVISAVGTREYYRKLGFSDGELYQFIDLPTTVSDRAVTDIPTYAT